MKAVPEDRVSECTGSQELHLLWHGDNSETQEMERPPLKTGNRGLVKGQQTKRTQCVYVVNCSQTAIENW